MSSRALCATPQIRSGSRTKSSDRPSRRISPEGARFGYKWFDSEGKQPLFEFGYGLSYTNFGYSDLHVDASARSATFTIANTGTRSSGTEIAQVYVALPAKSAEHFRRLAGWQRVSLKAGERKTVTVTMEPLTLAVFDEKKDGWVWLPGNYRVSVGASSRNLPLQTDAKLY